jgi:uncharacterized protein
MRLLMWLALAVLVILALRKKSQAQSTPSRPTSEQAPDQAAPGETMVCCERCQVYIPSSEAVLRGKKVYCCSAHADQA